MRWKVEVNYSRTRIAPPRTIGIDVASPAVTSSSALRTFHTEFEPGETIRSFSDAAAVANDAGFDDSEVFDVGGAFRSWIYQA